MGFRRLLRHAPKVLFCLSFGLLSACNLSWDTGLYPTYHYSYQPSWKAVGSVNISGGAVGDMSLVTRSGGEAFIVYQDWGPAKATALQLVGNNWLPLGTPGFSEDAISTPSAAYSYAGTPYVAFSDAAYGGAASVMWLNGTMWVPLGPPGFSGGMANGTSLVMNSGSVPYVAYSDAGAPIPGAATVMTFSGGSWELVGAQGFSGGGVSNTSIAIDASGMLYVGYVDGNTGNNVTVMKSDGVLPWTLVGSIAGFGPGSGLGNASLAINRTTHQPWLAFSEAATGGKLTVMMFDGTNWTTAGSRGFSVGSVSNVTLKFDSKGTACVAFSDAGLSGRAVVYKLGGSTWKRVGGVVSPGAAGPMALSVDSNDVPMCAFQDARAGFLNASVMSYH